MYRPMFIKSISKMSRADFKGFSPFSKAFSFTHVCDMTIATGVSRLLNMCSPTAIIFIIIAFVINSIKGIIRTWPIAYVFVKCFKRVEPFIAYFYTALAVIMKRFIVRVITPIFHVLPSVILRGFTHAMGGRSTFIKCGHNNFLSEIAQKLNVWRSVLSTDLRVRCPSHRDSIIYCSGYSN